jgi:decaprenyl-phosphate phosphoribosyltransferase
MRRTATRRGTMKAVTLTDGFISVLSRDAVLILRAMRPVEWIKNGFVFAPLFFSGSALRMDKLGAVILVFAAFSFMSSAVYIFNDIQDRDADRLHDKKRERPLASGSLTVPAAASAAVLLAAASIVFSSFSQLVIAIVLTYGGLNVLYGLGLKHIVILDVFTIATGFVLRVFAGGAAIAVDPSSWLVMATFLLSLFLGLAKRRQEMLVLHGVATAHRPVLEQYTIPLVDILIAVVTPATIVTYLLYTVDPETVARFHVGKLYLSGAFVVFAIFRYLYLIHRTDLGGSPTQLVITDRPLRTAIVTWIFVFAVIVYVWG